jgi:hypothetical protein
VTVTEMLAYQPSLCTRRTEERNAIHGGTVVSSKKQGNKHLPLAALVSPPHLCTNRTEQGISSMASSLPCNTLVILATSSYKSKETQLSSTVWKKLDLY